MLKAINQAIKAMGDRFESTEADVAKDHSGLEDIDPAATDDCIGTGEAYTPVS
jgi:hypothetical protein